MLELLLFNFEIPISKFEFQIEICFVYVVFMLFVIRSRFFGVGVSCPGGRLPGVCGVFAPGVRGFRPGGQVLLQSPPGVADPRGPAPRSPPMRGPRGPKAPSDNYKPSPAHGKIPLATLHHSL